jgi:hypothetical protein
VISFLQENEIKNKNKKIKIMHTKRKSKKSSQLRNCEDELYTIRDEWYEDDLDFDPAYICNCGHRHIYRQKYIWYSDYEVKLHEYVFQALDIQRHCFIPKIQPWYTPCDYNKPEYSDMYFLYQIGKKNFLLSKFFCSGKKLRLKII